RALRHFFHNVVAADGLNDFVLGLFVAFLFVAVLFLAFGRRRFAGCHGMFFMSGVFGRHLQPGLVAGVIAIAGAIFLVNAFFGSLAQRLGDIYRGLCGLDRRLRRLGEVHRTMLAAGVGVPLMVFMMWVLVEGMFVVVLMAGIIMMIGVIVMVSGVVVVFAVMILSGVSVGILRLPGV